HLISDKEYLTVCTTLIQSCKNLKKIILTDTSTSIKNIESFSPAITSFSKHFDTGDVEENEKAVIIYTAGTTGHPKGAMLSHRNIISNVLACTEEIEVTPKDKLLLILPMFHSFTFTVCIMMPISKGATIVALPSVKPFSDVIKSIIKYRVSIFIGIPKLYDILSEKKIPFFIRWLLNIRLCVSGSAPLSLTTLERFKENVKLPLLEGYGLSEASPVVALNPLCGEKKAGSVGLALKGVSVRIVDENMRDVRIGDVGEIAVKGDNVMLGYYNQPDATSETIIDGWLRTGDLGKTDQDNYIFIVKIKKNMLLVHGLNVYPREIEEVILAHPAIEEAAVVGLMDEHKNETPIGFVVVKPSNNVSPREIISLCREKLAGYKCPKRIIIIDKLPRSPLGKILKRELLSLIEK
ncbi:AMP-binding protein, partial [bacterium]|nr:AMP-binding protein [bacterium]